MNSKDVERFRFSALVSIVIAIAFLILFAPQLAYADGEGDVGQEGDQNTPAPVVTEPAPAKDLAQVTNPSPKEGDGEQPKSDPNSTGKNEQPEQPAADKAPQPAEGQSLQAAAADEKPEAYRVEREPQQLTAQSQAVSAQAAATPKAGLTFRVHVQNIGDQGWRSAGVGQGSKAMAGTSGRSLRMESLQFKLTGDLPGSVQYQVHVQNDGWQTVRADGQRAGTTGRSLRLEGLSLALVGEVSRYYDVYYRVHVQNDGWQGWRANGQYAGTTGRSLRLEAIEVYLKAKASPSAASDEGLVGVVYQGHVQNVGWQDVKNAGGTAGTTGQSLRVEALRIWLNKGKYSGGVEYRTHVQSVGWQGWKRNGSTAGTTGRSLRVEALQLRLTGNIANDYDVEYRTHVQNVGWQPWTVNGGTAGTTGRSLRVEAIEIRLVKKGSSQSVSNGTYILSLANDVSSEVAASGSKMKKAGYSATNAAGKFYVRNEGGGITLQSVSTGKFMTDAGTAVLQTWDGSTQQVWTLSRNGGLRLVNKATGKVLQLSGSSVVTGSGTGFMFNGTNLLNNGTYSFKNAAQGKALSVAGSSMNSGANVVVNNAGNGGNQAFVVTNKGGDWCMVVNARSYKAVEVGNGSKGEGANVRQFNTNGSNAQQWQPRLERDGSMYFVNRASGKALTASGAAGNGANVTSNSYNGSAQQKWSLAASSWSLTGDRDLDREIARIISSHNSLRSCFDYVVGFSYINGNKLGSQTVSDSTTRAMAKEMIEDGGGNCYRFASLFSWLARGLGYSTDVIAGYVPSASGGSAPHGWVEVYQNGKTYICDPDLAHELPGHDWYMVTYADAPVSYY